MNCSKSEGWNSIGTIKSRPQVYNDSSTRVTEHQFIWPHVVTARLLRVIKLNKGVKMRLNLSQYFYVAVCVKGLADKSLDK